MAPAKIVAALVCGLVVLIGSLSLIFTRLLDACDPARLKGLIIANDRLTFPESTCNLKRLDLSSNNLTPFPKAIGHLTQLEELDLRNNNLTSLPEIIGHLAQLEMLDLSSNKLTSLPDGICDLVQLKGLHVNDNQLAFLPGGIGNLTQLNWLNLRDNMLTSLPEGIGNLTQLERLYLGYNKLTSLPRSIERLANITLLDLTGNPLVEYGEGDALGWRELRNTFRDRVLHSRGSRRGPDREITEQEVYQRLRAVPLHWNVSRLASIALDPVTQHTLSGEEKDTASFEYFVENAIAVLKNYISEMVVMLGGRKQNMWKERLKDTLGVNISPQSRMGTFDQDVFGGRVGNALDAFYRKFTPGYVVGRLAEEISADEKRLSDARSFLHKRLDDREYAKRVFEFKSEEDTENLVPARIRSAGVEDILVDMGILKRGTASRGIAGVGHNIALQLLYK